MSGMRRESNGRRRAAWAVMWAGALLLAAAGCDEEPATGRPAVSAQGLPMATMTLGGETFTVELAYRNETRARGLMFREELGANEGMLFVFFAPAVRSFYMENCLFDLDILFIRADGRIAKITTMEAPREGEPLVYYPSGTAVQYALELPAGTAERLGLAEGDWVALPDEALRVMPEPD